MTEAAGGPTRDPVPVVAAVIRRDDEVLVALRPRHKRHGGLWEFPGGKVDDGESRLEAVRRELAEELGVEVVGLRRPLFSAPDPDAPFVIHFVETVIRGEPEVREHDALRWAAPTELRGLPLAPADRRFVEEHLAPEP